MRGEEDIKRKPSVREKREAAEYDPGELVGVVNGLSTVSDERGRDRLRPTLAHRVHDDENGCFSEPADLGVSEAVAR